MCFSPEADLTGGVIAGVVGFDTLRHVERPQQLVLAALPVVFAAHELDEVFVWLGLRGQVPWPVARVAIYVFLAVAFTLPFIVPLAILGVEPQRRRRRLLQGLWVLGAVGTAGLLAGIAGAPISAVIEGNHIAYNVDLTYGNVLVVLYLLATCGAMLAASNRVLVGLGLCNVVAVAALSYLTITGFTSLWCAWAAVSSVVIAVYLRRESRPVRMVESTSRVTA